MKFTTIVLLLFTLVAFASNSILCRLALLGGSVGPVEFTWIRLGAGAIALSPLVLFRKTKFGKRERQSALSAATLELQLRNLWPPLALFSYAIFFSLAYLQLDAGTGALILFASVQITMIGVSVCEGNKVTLVEWSGVLISMAGLVYLLLPGLSAPPLLGTLLMILSGVSWGVYSLLGRGQPQPILATARNFLFTAPAVAVLGLITLGGIVQSGSARLSTDGVLLAMLSGGVHQAWDMCCGT